MILLAVVLFAALSYAVTNSMRGGGGDASAESLHTAASELMNYATLVEQTVNRLRLSNGCSETQISFHYDSDGDGVLENSTQDAFYNPKAPTDYRCHVFRPEGGNLAKYQVPDRYVTDPTGLDGLAHYGGTTSHNLGFSAVNCVKGLGTTTAAGSTCVSSEVELIVFFSFLTPELCRTINDMIGLPTGTAYGGNPSANLAPEGNAFRGTYSTSATNLIPYTAAAVDQSLTGQHTFCMWDRAGSPAAYSLVHVLIAR